MSIGILHPGAMGAAVGAQLVSAGRDVRWVSAGRGEATLRRAESAGLTPCASIAKLAGCSVIISVCPPSAATDVAETVAGNGFAGIYLDANAISPKHAEEIAARLQPGGATVVDGGIVGPPPRLAGGTLLYLSGPEHAVREVSDLFGGTDLGTVCLDGPVGRASTLKLAFATYNKLSHALAAQAYALAGSHGVAGELETLARRTLPHTPLGRPEDIIGAGQRAWRWEGEMAEIGAACRDAELPDGLPRAAADLFANWRAFKDGEELSLPELIAALRHPGPSA